MDVKYREALWDARRVPFVYFMVAFFFGLSVNLWSGKVAPDSPLWWILAIGPLVLIAALILSPLLPALLPWADRDVVTSIFIERRRAAKGLVVFASLGKGTETARAAIRGHGETLERVWLVSSKDSRKDAESLASSLAGERGSSSPMIQHLEMADADFQDPEAVKDLVEERVYGDLPPGMSEHDVVIDITGGTKTTSAGAYLAGLPRGRRLEYVEPARKNEHGQGEIPGEIREIRIDYRLKKQKGRNRVG